MTGESIVFSTYFLTRVPPRKRYCNTHPIGLCRCNSVVRHSCGLGSPANGAGHEWHLRLPRSPSSTSRSSTNRLLHGQRHQFGTGSWMILHTPKREMVPDIFISPRSISCRSLDEQQAQCVTESWQLIQAHNLTTFSTSICTRSTMVPSTVSTLWRHAR